MFGLARRKKTKSQRFSKQCHCGEIISGTRTEEAQRRACAACGEEFSFLPVSPYPTPKMPRGYVPRVPVESDQNRLEVQQEEPEELPKKSHNPIKWLVGVLEEKTRPAKVEKIKLDTNLSFAQRLRKAITPFRLLAGLICFLLLLTGWYIYYQQQISWAEGVYSQAVTEAKEAFNAGNFEVAQERFADAGKAADLLGLVDEEAKQVRQYHREFEYLENRTSLSLANILNDPNEILKNSPDLWVKSFNSSYAGSRLLLDVRGELVENSEGKWVRVDCPVIGSPAVMEFWLPVTEQGNALYRYPNGSVHLIAGGTIEVCRKKPDQHNHWEVEFSDLLVWHHSTTLELAGLGVQDQELLTHQKQVLKIQSTHSDSSETVAETEPENAAEAETEASNPE